MNQENLTLTAAVIAIVGGVITLWRAITTWGGWTKLVSSQLADQAVDIKELLRVQGELRDRVARLEGRMSRAERE